MSASEGAASRKEIPAFCNPAFNTSASAGFTIVGHVLQRWPKSVDPPEVRLSPDQGGQYHLLSLWSPDRRRHYGDFNLSSGRFHIHENHRPCHDVIYEWPQEKSYVLAVNSQDFGVERVVRQVFAAIEVVPAEADSGLGATELAIGSLIARFAFEPPILIENGWVCGDDHASWLDELPDDCMMAPPYSFAGHAWRLQWDSNPEGGVIFIDSDIAYLHGSNEQPFEIPCELQKPECPLDVLVTRLERHLRAGAPPATT